MTGDDPATQKVERFILEAIESVPHIEALLLLWKSRPKQWLLEEIAKALYVPPERAQAILHDLGTRGLVAREAANYSYVSTTEQDSLIEDVDRIYRRDLIRISTMIHSKASPAVREFARAFRWKRD